jgi:hypothetical protein
VNPTEEDSGMLMSSMCNFYNCYCAQQKEDSGVLMSSVYICTHIGGKRGKWVSARVGKGSQIRQLTQGKGPAEMGIRSLVQGTAIPSKGLISSNAIKTADPMHYYNMCCLV